MNRLACDSPASSQDPADLWNEIVRWTLEACVQRREGRDAAARAILGELLPALIHRWSSRSPLPVTERKSRLRQLFTQAQSAVETGWLQRRLIVDELTRRLGAAPTDAAATRSGILRLRRRVPIGDVPGMLDALAEAEDECRREAVLPGRTVVPLAWQSLSAHTAPQFA